MAKLIARLTGNELFKFLLGLSAYLFLIIILLRTLERSSCVAEVLFLASVAALIIWTLYICLRRKDDTVKADSPNPNPGAGILQNAAISIAYWGLIAIILGNDFKYIWVLYALIGITAVSALVASALAKKK